MKGGSFRQLFLPPLLFLPLGSCGKGVSLGPALPGLHVSGANKSSFEDPVLDLLLPGLLQLFLLPPRETPGRRGRRSRRRLCRRPARRERHTVVRGTAARTNSRICGRGSSNGAGRPPPGSSSYTVKSSGSTVALAVVWPRGASFVPGPTS